MKTYNKKMLTISIIVIVLGVLDLIISIVLPEENLVIRLKDVIGAVVVIAIGVSLFFKEFNKRDELEDMIEGRNKRR